jgi:hypothetical protein
MTTITISRPTAHVETPQKKYWKTYAVFGAVLGLCALLNVVASVESMYSSSNSQELEYKKAELSAQIQQLEKEKSQAVNLNSIQTEAVAEGYSAVTKLQYASAPMTQQVAER